MANCYRWVIQRTICQCCHPKECIQHLTLCNSTGKFMTVVDRPTMNLAFDLPIMRPDVLLTVCIHCYDTVEGRAAMEKLPFPPMEDRITRQPPAPAKPEPTNAMDLI